MDIWESNVRAPPNTDGVSERVTHTSPFHPPLSRFMGSPRLCNLEELQVTSALSKPHLLLLTRQSAATLVSLISSHVNLCGCVQVNNLYLSDFPTHDMAADFVLLAEQWQTAEGALKEQYKVSPRGLYKVGGWGLIWGSLQTEGVHAEQGESRRLGSGGTVLEAGG